MEIAALLRRRAVLIGMVCLTAAAAWGCWLWALHYAGAGPSVGHAAALFGSQFGTFHAFDEKAASADEKRAVAAASEHLAESKFLSWEGIRASNIIARHDNSLEIWRIAFVGESSIDGDDHHDWLVLIEVDKHNRCTDKGAIQH